MSVKLHNYFAPNNIYVSIFSLYLLTKVWIINNRHCSFSKDVVVTATECAYKLNNTRYENFAHAVAVIRLHLSKKNNPLLLFKFLKHFLRHIYITSNHYVCLIVLMCNDKWNSLLNNLVTVTSGHVERKRTRGVNILFI